MFNVEHMGGGAFVVSAPKSIASLSFKHGLFLRNLNTRKWARGE